MFQFRQFIGMTKQFLNFTQYKIFCKYVFHNIAEENGIFYLRFNILLGGFFSDHLSGPFTVCLSCSSFFFCLLFQIFLPRKPDFCCFCFLSSCLPPSPQFSEDAFFGDFLQSVTNLTAEYLNLVSVESLLDDMSAFGSLGLAQQNLNKLRQFHRLFASKGFKEC